MVKVINKSKSRIWIGNKVIKPSETAELTKDELSMSGVKVLINEGKLEIVKK